MLKYFRYKGKKGQSTLEYAILIIIIVGALLTVQNYIKRGIQGRLKSATDDIGEQFSPGNMNALKRTTTRSTTSEINKNGVKLTDIIGNEYVNEVTSYNIINDGQEFWGKK